MRLHICSRHSSKKTAITLLAFALMIAGVSSVFGQPVRVQDDEAKKAAVQKIQPTYPPIARQLNLSGRVIVDLNVDPEGAVDKVDVVSGNPILATSAVTAAKRWKFQPFQLEGKPTEAVVRIAFDFNK